MRPGFSCLDQRPVKPALGPTNHAAGASDLRRAGHRCQAVRPERPRGKRVCWRIASLIAVSGHRPAFRGNVVLLKRINVIWAVQSPLQKFFRSLLTQITCISLAVSSHWRGGSRSSRTRGGMRWTRMVPITNGARGGRRSRVVLTPRRWRQVGERDFTGDGGNQARSPGRARNKLLKPSRGECRVIPV
jgi:hypothetical protein